MAERRQEKLQNRKKKGKKSRKKMLETKIENNGKRPKN